MKLTPSGREKRVTLSLPRMMGYALQESGKGNDVGIEVYNTKHYYTGLVFVAKIIDHSLWGREMGGGGVGVGG